MNRNSDWADFFTVGLLIGRTWWTQMFWLIMRSFFFKRHFCRWKRYQKKVSKKNLEINTPRYKKPRGGRNSYVSFTNLDSPYWTVWIYIDCLGQASSNISHSHWQTLCQTNKICFFLLQQLMSFSTKKLHFKIISQKRDASG